MLRITILCLLCCYTFSASETLHIACIGDSITQGRGGDKPELSYRYPLWKLFIDNNISHTFVGSMNSGFESTPNYPDYKDQQFSNINEGHWGWPTVNVNNKLAEWIKAYPQLDIALVQLGTNDKRIYKKEGLSVEDGIQASLKEYRRLIQILRQRNPQVVIVFGECMHAWEPFPTMNKGLKEIATEMSSDASPIAVAPLSKGWISDPKNPQSDTIDWVHTSARGDAKMAKAFWATLQPLLPAKK